MGRRPRERGPDRAMSGESPNQAQAPQQGMPIDQALALARAHWDAGQADQAERLCQQVLAVWPGQSDALHLLGLMAHAYGNFDSAIEHLRRACQSPRAPATYHSDLAEMCRRKGTYADAEQAGRRAVALDPTLVAGWNNLGIILQEAGKLEESTACLERVVNLQPGNAEGHNNLGNTLKRLGRLDQARQRYEAALALAPNYAEAWSNLANLLNDLGQPDQALSLARRAIEANPRLVDAYINAAAIEVGRNRYGDALRWTDALLAFAPMHPGGMVLRATALKYLERLDEALGAAQLAVSGAPESSEALHALGQVLQAMGKTDDALEAYERAMKASGFAAEKAVINRGVALMERGDKADARAEMDRAVTLHPRSAAAWHTRSELKTFTADDPEIARMATLLGPGGLQARDDRIALHYALGKAWMDAGDVDQAFAYLNEGSRLKRATFAYDADATDLWLRSIADGFSRDILDRLAGGGAPSELPVFVFGMPRSGTSLVEQILASHPRVCGAGELSTLSRVIDLHGAYPDLLRALTPETTTRMGQAYLDQIAPLAVGKTRLINKMPWNFLFAGLITLILPQARIIHVRRNPMDNCLSCYTKLFATEQLFTYDLAELGRFYRGYGTLMDHWRAVLPADRFMEVRYEDVVADLEGEARRMVDFLGLPWNDGCLRFERTARIVRTASVNQVRQPIFTTSIDRWKPFASHLAPLSDALGMTRQDR
jgi:tetratricopeptide (TPR) repeat protein